MAELFVPGIIDRLAEIVLPYLNERVNLVVGVEEDVRGLSHKLATLDRVLHDAERRKFKEEDVWIWLERLEDTAHEMDDVLDEWNMKIVEPSLKNVDLGNQNQVKATLVEKVTSLIPSLRFRLKQVPIRSDIARSIKKINGKLELTLREANQFNFVSSLRGQVHSNDFKRLMSTSIFDVSEVCGRDSDKDSLLKHLLSEMRSSSEEQVLEGGVKVITIVGAGGAGKTTLAQFLYNDERVSQYFELKKWVCVSDSFDAKRIAKALVESPEKSNMNVSEWESELLYQQVRNSFSGRRFLIVFDDVWTEKYSEWKPFRDSLKDGAPGSILLLTTRKEKVSRLAGTYYKHSLSILGDSDCWLIIKRVALSDRSELCERVEMIGKEIAKKCKGLPLAARTMGSLLQFKDTAYEWQEVLDSEIWHLKEAALELFPHFYLSYNELSPGMKRCFSYCAVFPKDTEIDVQVMIRLWMAQGYLGRPSQSGDDKLEKKGYEYFKMLATLSFFQDLRESSIDGNVIDSCKMHDIVHDFAQFVAKSECRVFEDLDRGSVTPREVLFKERLRHVTMLGTYKSINSSRILDVVKVRSLFLKEYGEFPQDLCHKFKSMRSLTLSFCGLRELPREIGNLIHIRLLNISGNHFTELPASVCDLHYLETLDVSWCIKLTHLPERIGDLVHLRHLHNDFTRELKVIPRGVEMLTSLRVLEKFIFNGEFSNNIAKLKYLECLNIYFVMEDFDSRNGSLIDMIEPPPSLRMLQFLGYPATQLCKWVVAKSLVGNLTCLTLHFAPQISSLSNLGKLSSLQYLSLIGLPRLKHLGCEFYGITDLQAHGSHVCGVQTVAFSHLKTLHIESFGTWETWEDISEKDGEEMETHTISVMPRLENLQVWGCRELKALPHRILRKASLKRLSVCHCNRLMELYSNKKGEDWMSISHIPHIDISG